VDLKLLVELSLLMVGVGVVTSAAGVAQTFLAIRVGQSVMRDLRATLYERLKRMPLRFFTATRTGEIQSRLTNDVSGIDDVITHVAQDSLANVVILVSSLVAMLLMSWQLTVLSFAIVPVFAWFTHRTGHAGHRKWRAVQETVADMTALTEETLSVSGVLLGKAFGREAAGIRRFNELNSRLTAVETAARMNGRIFWAWVGIFFAAARRSASAATASRAARSSGWRSPARCSRSRASSFSTRRPRRSTRPASASCTGRSSRSSGRGRRSPSPTASRRSSPPT
jgi:ATP-binding cassette subfamily B protein